VSVQHNQVNDPWAARTIPQLVRAAAAAYGDAIAVKASPADGPEETISFRELERRSAELARGLVARGVGKGSRVGFICANGPDFALYLAAITRAGGVAIPLSTLIKAGELVRTLRQSDVSGLIVQRSLLGHDYVERLCEALPELAQAKGPELRIAATPFLRWIVTDGEDLPRAFRRMDFLTGAAGEVSEALLAEIEAEVHPADQAIEIYTSGSMALPKGVKHNHGPVAFRAQKLAQQQEVKRGAELVCMLPMFWVGGLMMSLMPNLAAGATTLCAERLLSNSRVAMGSVMAEDDLKLIAMSKPYWGLGMTETLGPYSWGDELRAPGYPMCAPMDHFGEGYEVRVWTGERVAGDGEIGEIQVRGYPLSPGLHKIERAEHFEPDGFYHTGDMGLVQGSRVNFVGRNGDMIKTASANVSPAEVEMELQSLPSVHSAYVVGVPDKERGQLVVAALVPREGARLDLGEIEATLKKRLSSYKVPRAYFEFAREEVPLLHSNKVARRQLERILAERLGRG
jgi:acyl-CoA synthetase (AMP-forming)/AMP-acid ligase II